MRKPVLVLLSALLGAPCAWAEPMPMRVERGSGVSLRSAEGAVRAVQPGEVLDAGMLLRTEPEGHAQVSMLDTPTLALGAQAEALLHSVEGTVLRARLQRGAAYLDTRAHAAAPERDVRLNLSDLRLRVQGAQAWVQMDAAQAQVCVLSGRIELQLPERADALDFAGQCVARANGQTRWSVVSVDMLARRVAAARGERVAAPVVEVAEGAVDVVVSEAPAAIVIEMGEAPVELAAAPAPPAVPPSAPVAPPVSAAPMPVGASAVAPPAIESAGEPAVEIAVRSEPPAPDADPAAAAPVDDDRHWSVVLASGTDRAAAEREALRLNRLGLAAEARAYRVGERQGFRVGVGRYSTRADADSALHALRDLHPQLKGWLARY